MVTNFSKSITSSEPTLLSFNDIKVFFHEFGHTLRCINTQSKWIINLDNIKSDFDEVPSQMQENFIYEPIILERISHHYKDYNKKMPKKLIDGLTKSRKFDDTFNKLIELYMSIGDFKFYSMGEMNKDFNIVKYWDDVERDVLMINIDENWEFAGMSHSANSMSSAFYTYLGSLVIAQDVYSKISENGVINPEMGMKYRKTILESGAVGEPMDYIKEFLGREPNNNAFIKTLGI